MTEMSGATIDHQREQMQADALGHELGCVEWAAEVVCETLAEQGVTYGTGGFDEVIDGMSVIDRVTVQVATGTFECHCLDPAE